MPLPAPPPTQRRWTLLLVDDEKDVLDSVQDLLESEIPGLRVVPASSGQDGLRRLDQGRIDLVVSDFRMPNMDGLEFLYQCGLKHPRVPRVILTAFSIDDVANRAQPDAGIAAFLSKTSDPKDLVRWIRRRLESAPASAVASLAKAGVLANPRVPAK